MTQPSTVSHSTFIRARAGRSAALGEHLNRLLEPSRTAAGCLHFALQHSQCDADLWLISGFWADQQAMTAWFASPVMQVFDDLLALGLVNSLDVHTFNDATTQGVATPWHLKVS
ncbi:MAG: antibiotic biosynthesis monooxygenase [Pseudomonas sp.]|uniref:antibiotic biosynthesis monooxygenase family protein n=1 Tax=Pseudomonas abieticivorans TaxID=2931382 RepID=UPI0020BE405D|nr:antibiotic biosynthesis monooxygenase family protein [Pseudomonas sp. PIA16]MDE1163970.1 antibiotic biosynthesis monooxygenase [Pseudomonas sp.]